MGPWAPQELIAQELLLGTWGYSRYFYYTISLVMSFLDPSYMNSFSQHIFQAYSAVKVKSYKNKDLMYSMVTKVNNTIFHIVKLLRGIS